MNRYGIKEPDLDNPDFGKVYYHFYEDGKYLHHCRGIYRNLASGDFIQPSTLGYRVWKVIGISELKWVGHNPFGLKILKVDLELT